MRYEIMGPLRVVNGAETHSLTAPKTEVLLATLLINAGQVLTIDQLRGEIWAGHAPPRTLATLYWYVSQLRKFLRGAGHTRGPIVTRRAGYLLSLEDDELDVHMFTGLMRQGREHADAGRYESANAAFSAALALHRGPAVGDLGGGPIVDQFRAWLSEAYLVCTESLIDVKLALGRHGEAVGRLYSLTTEHPYHETFYGQLMRALCHSGRRADALKVYHSAGSRLMVDLGVEPSRGLRRIHDAIISSD